jgi:hypothetical protein
MPTEFCFDGLKGGDHSEDIGVGVLIEWIIGASGLGRGLDSSG